MNIAVVENAKTVILSAAKDLWLGTAQILRCAQDDKWRAACRSRPETLLSSQFLPSRLQLAQALLLGCQLLTLLLDHPWPGPGNKGSIRELALNARDLLLSLRNLLVETFQFSA